MPIRKGGLFVSGFGWIRAAGWRCPQEGGGEGDQDNDKFSIKNDSLFTNYEFIDYKDATCIIYVKSSDHKGESIAKHFSFTINKTTSFNPLTDKETKFRIYPNPVVDYLNISLQADSRTIKIFDVVGNLKSVLYNKSNEVKIDFGNFKNGLYIIRIEMNDGSTSTDKVLKKD